MRITTYNTIYVPNIYIKKSSLENCVINVNNKKSYIKGNENGRQSGKREEVKNEIERIIIILFFCCTIPQRNIIKHIFLDKIGRYIYLIFYRRK